MKCRIVDLDFNDSPSQCGVTVDYHRSVDLYREAIGIRALVELWDSTGSSCGGVEITATFAEAKAFAIRLLERIGEHNHPALGQAKGS